jgi:hypothetical protein
MVACQTLQALDRSRSTNFLSNAPHQCSMFLFHSLIAGRSIDQVTDCRVFG